MMYKRKTVTRCTITITYISPNTATRRFPVTSLSPCPLSISGHHPPPNACIIKIYEQFIAVPQTVLDLKLNFRQYYKSINVNFVRHQINRATKKGKCSSNHMVSLE